MLSLTARRGAGSRYRAGARAFVLLLGLAASLAAAPARPPTADGTPGRSQSPAAAKDAPPAAGKTPAPADPTTDPDAALQRLAAEAEKIDPSAPDAVARLRSVVRGLIEVERARGREIAALRAELGQRPSTSVARQHSRKTTSGMSRVPLSAAPGEAKSVAAAAGGGDAASAGPLFGKRGLKKVHRVGCPFGERIRAEDRVFFKTVAEAQAAGYEPCKTCRPADP
jgi:hypothetical protein